MNQGFILTLLLGILWSLVGTVVALARRREFPIGIFYCIGAGLATLICSVTGAFSPETLAGITMGELFFLISGALLNSLGQALTMYNLHGEAKALLYALPQTNFVFAFLFAWLFLGESATGLTFFGVGMLTLAVLASGIWKGKKDHALPGLRQLTYGVGAAVITGGGQIALLLASRRNPELSSYGTVGVVLFFSFLFYGIGTLRNPAAWRKISSPVLLLGAAWGTLAFLAFSVLFRTLPIMSGAGRGGLVFAIAGAVAILSFWVISRCFFGDRFSWKQTVIMLTIIAGIALLRY